MQVTLYYTTDDRRKLDKSLNGSSNRNCTLKGDCSVINPTLLITASASQIATYNYVYIPTFKRYYFIDNITVLTNNIIQIDCSVDVLMSYNQQIKALSCVISRQENQYNAFIVDERFLVDNKTLHFYKQFPAIFRADNYTYIMST